MPNPNADDALLDDDVQALADLKESYQKLRDELSQVIVGQESVIEQIAICLFSRGHSLLMGVPGLAKTLLVSRLAETLDLSFNRIQFTPDLMPMDITGTEILQQRDDGQRTFHFEKGPVFAQIVLADEINRAPAKTQAAMLEAMQEHRVTAAGHTYELDQPFFVLATQNPIEQEGTYPLPEAQLDRFMFMIVVEYPTRDEEMLIAKTTTGATIPKLEPVMDGETILKYQNLVRRIPVPDHLYQFAVDFVRRTRPDSEEAPDWLKPLVSWGAGPRAVQNLILGARTRAALYGNYMVRQEDLVAVTEAVLQHRIVRTFAAESQGVTCTQIIQRLVEERIAEQAE